MMTAKPEVTLTIQQMAGRSGLSEYTLRYYEKVGLIEPIPRDRSSGHRRYSPQTAQKVEALACLRACGLSLNDMRRFFDLWERGDEAGQSKKRCIWHTPKKSRRKYINSKFGNGI